jgi:hypothetical protein
MSYQEFEHQPANSAPAENKAVENVARGTIFALAIIPVGIIVFVVIWNLGWLASIVSYGVAVGAVFLYRLGAGGVVGRAGALRIAIITIGTILLSIVVALITDVAQGYANYYGTTPLEELTDPMFLTNFQYTMSEPGVFGEYLPSIGIALGLGLLGCFSLLRGVFTAPVEATTPQDQVQPLPPQRAEPDFSDRGYTPSADAAAPVAPAFPPAAPQYGELAPPAEPAPPVGPPIGETPRPESRP